MIWSCSSEPSASYLSMCGSDRRAWEREKQTLPHSVPGSRPIRLTFFYAPSPLRRMRMESCTPYSLAYWSSLIFEVMPVNRAPFSRFAWWYLNLLSLMVSLVVFPVRYILVFLHVYWIINVLWLSLYVPRRGFLVAMVVLACVRGLALVCRVLGGIDGRGLV